MTQAPKISVVMAVYNGSTQIGGALSSLFAQSFVDWELLIVDDASTDDTRSVVEQFVSGDPRVFFHRLPCNVGPGAARNVGLAAARGEWFTVLDGDDAYEPDRLRILLERAVRDDLDVLADNLTLYDEAVTQSLGPAFAMDGDSCDLTARLLVKYDCPPSMIVLGQLKPFVRRSFLTATGVRYPEDLRVGEDFQFLFDLLERTPRTKLITYCGYCYTLPFSPKVGRQSAGTRTTHGTAAVDELARGTARLIDRIGGRDRQDRPLAALLQKRLRRLQDEGIWRRARSCVRTHEYFAAICLLARLDPIYAWAQATVIFSRKMGKIQTVLRLAHSAAGGIGSGEWRKLPASRMI